MVHCVRFNPEFQPILGSNSLHETGAGSRNNPGQVKAEEWRIRNSRKGDKNQLKTEP
jgi:hypothetical protein